jgi:acyl-CoA reductase-like NAD-dependent aldehyde dehydrogenase
MREVEAICKRAASEWTVGDPSHPDTRLGPVANRRQFETVQRHIATALDEGAQLVAGGPGRPAGYDKGYFVRPTVFSGVTMEMSLAHEEVFGPVLAIMPYTDTPFRSRTERRTDCPAGCSVRLHGARLRLPGVCARGRS